MAENPIDRLLSQLNTSGLSQKDNPLFQIISELIKAVRDVTVSSSGGSGGGGGGGLANQSFITYGSDTATLPNSLQLIPGQGLAFNRINKKLILNASIAALRQAIAESERGQKGFPGDKGNKGDKGDTGLRGLAGEDGNVGPRGFIGPQGVAGATGAVGPRGLPGDAGDVALAQLPRPLWDDTSIITITNTGTVNDLDYQNADIILCDNAANLTITGIKAGSRGKILTFVSINAGGHVFFKPQNAGSTAPNRLINYATVGDTPLGATLGNCMYRYDNVTGGWRLIHHNQGTFITPAFAAGDYTANGGGGAWTLTAPDVVSAAYFLKGRELTVLLVLNTTTTVGAANTELRRVIPGGYTCATECITANLRVFAGAARQQGYFYGAAGATFMRFFYDLTGAANWPAVVNNADIQGTCVFQIQ